MILIAGGNMYVETKWGFETEMLMPRVNLVGY